MPLEIKIRYANADTRRLEIFEQGNWIDLSFDKDVFLEAGEFELVPLGVAMQVPYGYEAHVIPRSSTFLKYGIIQGNHFGLIDTSYCGDTDWWKFPAYATRTISVARGTRICQFRIQEIQPKIQFVEVSLLGNKDRSGFGSTDKKL